ncbi:tonsoku-like protein [Amphibalanus amphitrite]|uniref:tonsoku-like protein n=1 Tax=Amphibalanus amphitrite TaxID=1232801 RepID=UPI001C8FC827|nr:tonsoku-like protein [Amphibalanus amphitrite]
MVLAADELTKLRRKKKAAQAKGNLKEQADYCNNIGVMLFKAGRLDEALEEHQEELTLCQTLRDSIGAGVAHRGLGDVFCELGQLDEALRHHLLFLEAAERQRDLVEIQRATATVGRTYLMQADNTSSGEESKNEYRKLANKFLERSLQLVPSVTGISEHERAEMTARLHLNMGIVWAQSGGRTDQARAAFSKALALTERHGLHDTGRRIHVNLAQSYQNAGDVRTALGHLRMAVRLAEKLQDRATVADALHSLAQVHLSLEELDEACRTWYKAYRQRSPRDADHKQHTRSLRYALRLCRAEGELDALSEDDYQARRDLHEHMADSFCQLKAFSPALRHYEAQLEYAEKLNSPESAKAAIYASLAQTHKDLHQYDQAKRWYEKELESRTGNATEICKTLMNLASLEEEMGGSVGSICDWYRRAASEAAVAGLTRLRASALRDLADTCRDHGLTEDEERARRDLALALRADNLHSSEESERDEEPGSEAESSGAESLDQDMLDLLVSETDQPEPLQRQRQRQRQRRGGSLWRNNKGETHLHLACIQGKSREVERLLRSGHPVNVRDFSGWLPLHEAANFGHTAIVALLLEHGAHVNDPGGQHCGGVTPLHDAAGNGHLAVARQLLAAGADPGAVTEDGTTPLEYLMNYRAQNLAELDAEQLNDLRVLEHEMKEILSSKGKPIPDSPSLRVSQSGSSQSTESPTVVEDSSEVTPSPAVSDEDDQPAADVYRRAIRGVGRSAVTAPATGTVRRRQRPSPAGPKPGLVSEDQYQWLEEDVATGRRRPRRRLSGTLASAGTQSVRRISPPPDEGVRPISPLQTIDDYDEPLQPDQLGSPVGTAAGESQPPPPEPDAAVRDGFSAERRPMKRRQSQLTFTLTPGGRADRAPSPAVSPSPAPPAKQQRVASEGAVWSSGALRVCVQVEQDRLMVQVPAAAAGRPHTVQWLAEQASDRYYKQFLLRPRLELLKDGALLAPEDPVQDVVGRQEETLGSRVLDWERPPLTERYSSVCAQLGQPPLATVSARLAVGQTSGRLNLAELRLNTARLQPVLRAIQRYGCITHLLLAGNPLRDAGARELAAALPHLSALHTLDLSGVQIGAGGLSYLATAASEQRALEQCTTLQLAYNLFSDVSSASHLAALVSTLPRLASLDLTSCQLTERHLSAAGRALCDALSGSHLTHLRLSHNSVSPEGTELLLRALRPQWLLSLALAGWRGVAATLQGYTLRDGDCCLQELDLRHCRLTDQEAEQLASALSGCRHLVRLDLSHNGALGRRGRSALEAAGCPLVEPGRAG